MTDKRKKIQIRSEEEKEINFYNNRIPQHGTSIGPGSALYLFTRPVSISGNYASGRLPCQAFIRKEESISYCTPGNQLHRAVRKSLLIVEAEKENSYQVDVI